MVAGADERGDDLVAVGQAPAASASTSGSRAGRRAARAARRCGSTSGTAWSISSSRVATPRTASIALDVLGPGAEVAVGERGGGLAVVARGPRGGGAVGSVTPAVASGLQRCLPRVVLGPERFRGGCTFGARSRPEGRCRDSPTRVRQRPEPSQRVDSGSAIANGLRTSVDPFIPWTAGGRQARAAIDDGDGDRGSCRRVALAVVAHVGRRRRQPRPPAGADQGMQVLCTGRLRLHGGHRLPRPGPVGGELRQDRPQLHELRQLPAGRSSAWRSRGARWATPTGGTTTASGRSASTTRRPSAPWPSGRAAPASPRARRATSPTSRPSRPTGIEITDDTNGGGTRRLRITRGSPYWPDDFVHIHDVGPPTELRGRGDLGPHQRPPAAAGGPARPRVRRGRATCRWWGTGTATATTRSGVFRDGTWVLVRTHRGDVLPTRTLRFGQAGDVPVVGDWDGDGDDTRRPVPRRHLDPVEHADQRPRVADRARPRRTGDVPVVGDWDGIGGDTVGAFHDGTWTLTERRLRGDRRFQLRFGGAGDRPVVGDWDGVRGDTDRHLPGRHVAAPQRQRRRRRRAARSSSSARGTRCPVVGDWDGKAGDTIGVVH